MIVAAVAFMYVCMYVYVWMYPISSFTNELIWIKLCTNVVAHTVIINIYMIFKQVYEEFKALFFVFILCSLSASISRVTLFMLVNSRASTIHRLIQIIQS